MCGDQSVEDGLGDLLVLGVEAGDGLELVPQLVVGSALVLLEDELICAHAERNNDPADHVEGRLRGARLVAPDLHDGQTDSFGESLLRQALLLAKSDESVGEGHGVRHRRAGFEDREWRPPPLPFNSFVYDTATTHGAGKLHQAVRHNRVDLPGDGADTISDIVVTESYDYAAKGGRVSSRRTTNSLNDLEFLTGFTYRDLGRLAQLAYPDCQVSSHCPAGEPARVVASAYSNGYLSKVGTTTDPEAYAQSITYHSNGLWNQITRKSNVVTTQSVAPDSMRRPRQIEVSGLASGTPFDTGTYAFDGAGNITSMGTDSFDYDTRSRLDKASVHGLSLDFDYDDFGNLTQRGTVSNPVTINVSASTNRIADTQMAGYDDRGNVTSFRGELLEYGPFSRLTHRNADGGPNDDALWTALYTADDERLAVCDATGAYTVARWSLRDLGGQVLSLYLYEDFQGEEIFADGFESGDPCAWSSSVGGSSCRAEAPTSPDWIWARDYIWRDGQLLAEIDDGETLDLHTDHLGSLRQVTDGSGDVVEDHDFLPFGEEVTQPTVETMLFTGHERDHHTETELDDLDYMHARYYSPNVGRFLSVDPVPGAPSRPQTWNRYSYARNGPINYLDPDGLLETPYNLLGTDPPAVDLQTVLALNVMLLSPVAAVVAVETLPVFDASRGVIFGSG